MFFPPVQVEPEKLHVAVLPFGAIGGDEFLQLEAEGLRHTITNGLAKFEGLNSELLIVSPQMVVEQAVKGPGEARTKLGVTHVVEGQLRSQGELLRLNLSLVNAETADVVDADTVEGKRAEMFALEERAVTRLAGLLNLTIQPEHAVEYAERSPIVPGAYQFYVRGRAELQRNDRETSIDNAISLFESALEIDNAYALAYAGLGEAQWNKYRATGEPEWNDKAVANCLRALDLNDGAPQVLVTIGRIRSGAGEHSQAVKHFEEALNLDSTNVDALLGLGSAYGALGEFERARAAYLAAIDRRPYDWNAYEEFGLFYYRRGDFRQAIQQFQQVVALTPDNAQAYANLGSFYYHLGDHEEARRMWERSIEIEPRHSAFSNLGKLLSNQRDYSGAAARYEQAIELKPRDHRLWANLAAVSERAGDVQKARRARRNAIGLVESALAADPDRVDLLSHLAHQRAALGEDQSAADVVDRAITLKPQEPGVLLRLADTCEQLGRRETALSLTQQACAQGYPVHTVEKSSYLGKLIHDSLYRSRFESCNPEAARKPEKHRPDSAALTN